MLIAITGLHGSGKSYFSHCIPPKYGFEVFYKNDIIAEIFNNKTNWIEQYREAYKNNPESLIKEILSHLPLEKNVILDAVHSYEEWKIIKSLETSARLILVTTPREVRISRRKENENKDVKRIQYWHSIEKDSVNCLLTQVSWSFNGGASLENNEKNFVEFLNFLNKQEKNVYSVENNEENVLNEELKKLIQEKVKLEKQIEEAKQLLNRCIGCSEKKSLERVENE